MRTLYFAAFILIPLAFPAFAGNPDDCASLERIQTGKSCGKAESVNITITNSCSNPMDLRFCLETINGNWNCGLQFTVAPGKPVNWMTCEGTGKYKIWARTPKVNVQFPEENGSYRTANRAVFAVASGETEESGCKRASDMPGAEGKCECETPDANSDFVRCRVEANAEVVAQSGRTIRAFEPTMFPVVVTSRTRDFACAEARRLAESPDGACSCQSKGSENQCRVASSKIRRAPLKEEINKELRCSPALGAGCKPDGKNGSSGVRG